MGYPSRDPNSYFGTGSYANVRQGYGERLFARVREDLRQYTVVQMDVTIAAEAERLLEDYSLVAGLRVLDSIQLAAALSVPKLDGFVTTDRLLGEVAAREGLHVLPRSG